MNPDISRTRGLHPDPQVWIQSLGIGTTKDVEVPKRLIDQVIGQDDAVNVALQAAEQRRHLLLIGEPGTGKSMLARAMTEILPQERMNDVLVYHNEKNPNLPKVLQVDGGTGRPVVEKYEAKAKRLGTLYRAMEYAVAIGALTFGLWLWMSQGENILVFLFVILIALLFLYAASQKRPKSDFIVPKILVEHAVEPEAPPYVDGTGSHAGALLGDVRHDPYQSGGLETAPHSRVEVGAIHRAHRGILFVDEINVLRLPSQQALLTALQDRQYAIVGQSQGSAGAMTSTEPVPCDFILVAAGNLDAVRPPDDTLAGGMHPALRSRIRGYGYEVFVNDVMEDTHENRVKLVQFVAQEVVRDGRIPHFDMAAIAEIIRQAQRRSGQKGTLTLRLRELGGLVRTAGDYAAGQKVDLVAYAHVRSAIASAMSLEQQITQKEISKHRKRQQVKREGSLSGVANGSAIVGVGDVGEPAGLVVAVEAAVVPALSRSAGALVLGETLKRQTRTGVANVGAILKVIKGGDIANHDIHLDASISHPDANAEGIGLAAAVAAISALEHVAVDQGVVAIGSVAISGQLRSVDAMLQRIEAAADLGFKTAAVPAELEEELLLDDHVRDRIRIVYCASLVDVLDAMIDAPEKEKSSLLHRAHAASSEARQDVGLNGGRETRVTTPRVSP